MQTELKMFGDESKNLSELGGSAQEGISKAQTDTLRRCTATLSSAIILSRAIMWAGMIVARAIAAQKAGVPNE